MLSMGQKWYFTAAVTNLACNRGDYMHANDVHAIDKSDKNQGAVSLTNNYMQDYCHVHLVCR
jgi:hypothetical protein